MKYDQALKLRVENAEMLGYVFGASGLCAFAINDLDAAANYHLSHINIAHRVGLKGVFLC